MCRAHSTHLFSILISNDNAGAKLLKQLSKINRPLEIKFAEMLNLMNQCDIVEKQHQKRHGNRNTSKSNDDNSFQFKNNPFSLFSGILPGNLKSVRWIQPNIQFLPCCDGIPQKISIMHELAIIVYVLLQFLSCICRYKMVRNRFVFHVQFEHVDFLCNLIHPKNQSSFTWFACITGDIATTYSDLGKCHGS